MPKKLLLVAALLVVVVGGGVWSLRGQSVKLSSPYQAVFLSNNQVYFGHLSGINDSTPKLTDVFQLTIDTSPQGAAGDEAAAGEVTKEKSTTATATSFKLVPASQALSLNRSQIVFIEDLSKDSQVLTEINKYKAGTK